MRLGFQFMQAFRTLNLQKVRFVAFGLRCWQGLAKVPPCQARQAINPRRSKMKIAKKMEAVFVAAVAVIVLGLASNLAPVTSAQTASGQISLVSIDNTQTMTIPARNPNAIKKTT
jgi:hypothetical protein